MADRLPLPHHVQGQGQVFRHSQHGLRLDPLAGSSSLQSASPSLTPTSPSASHSPQVQVPTAVSAVSSPSPSPSPQPPVPSRKITRKPVRSAATSAGVSPVSPNPPHDPCHQQQQHVQHHASFSHSPQQISSAGGDYFTPQQTVSFTQPLLSSQHRPNLPDDTTKAHSPQPPHHQHHHHHHHHHHSHQNSSDDSSGEEEDEATTASRKESYARLELLVRRAEFRRRANWKPPAMRTLYLLILGGFSAALIAGIEVLMYMSRRPQGKPNTEFADFPKGIVRYHKTDLTDVSIWRYFAWNYLPILIQVAYGIFWEATDAAVKKCEPYYQLTSADNHERGCLGSHCLTVNYFEFWVLLTPFQALRLRHWAVFCSSLASVLAFALAPIFQSGLFTVRNFEGAREPFIVIVDPVFARLLQGTLGMILLLDVALIFILTRRRTGLLHDPGAIASVACIAAESDAFLSEFRGVMTERTQAMKQRFATQRYRLNFSEREDDGSLVYRIENTGQGVRPDVLHLRHHRLYNETSFFSRMKSFFTSIGESILPPDGHPPILHLLCIIPFLLVLLFKLFFFIGLYMWLRHIPSFLNFHKALGYFSARTTSIAFTAVSISLKTVWSLVDKSLRLLQPYHTLNKQHAPARRSIFLDYTATAPLWVTIKAAYNRDGLLACTTAMTSLVEVYTVTVGSSVNFALALYQSETKNGMENLDNDSVTQNTGNISFVLSIVILSGMIIFTIVVYIARRKPFLPRDMGCIASVVSLLYASSLLHPTEPHHVSMTSGSKEAATSAHHLERTISTSTFAASSGGFKGLSTTRDIRGNERSFELLRHRRYGFGWFRAREPLPPTPPSSIIANASDAEVDRTQYNYSVESQFSQVSRGGPEEDDGRTWCLGIEDSSRIEAAGAYKFGDERMDQAVRRQEDNAKRGWFGFRRRRTGLSNGDNPADRFRGTGRGMDDEGTEMLRPV